MKKIVVTAASAALVVVGLAAPAQAYDRELYSYAAGHMVGSSDIPASLKVRKGANFNAYPARGRTFLCQKPGESDDFLQFPGGDYGFSVNYQGRGRDGGIGVTVMQYASSQKAIAAFDEVKKGLRACAGAANGQETNDDGSTDTWSRLTTTGNVPLVTVAGVPSVFINQNYEDVVTGEYPDRYTSDSYNVYTLVNDVIINTNHYTGSELNMATSERRAVNQVAFNAVTRWVD